MILAFDQASRTSGYSVFQGQELIAHGTFSFTDDNIGIRLVKIRNKVLELINQFHPDKVIYEDIQLQQNTNNVSTYKVLAEVFGVIHELATELKIDNEACLSGTWRKGLGIVGRQRAEQKKNAQRWVKDHYGLKVSEDNADAICIGAYSAGIRCAKQEKIQPFDWAD